MAVEALPPGRTVVLLGSAASIVMRARTSRSPPPSPKPVWVRVYVDPTNVDRVMAWVVVLPQGVALHDRRAQAAPIAGRRGIGAAVAVDRIDVGALGRHTAAPTGGEEH
jgi:hypothetical protein